MNIRARFYFFVSSFLLISNLSGAQSLPHHISFEKKPLMSMYRQWPATYGEKKSEFKEADAQTASSLFYPAKATNYIWNTTNSNWDFFDTTLYTYAGTLISSATRKDNSNNFLTRVLNSYDVSDNMIDAIHQDWVSSWVNNYRDTFVFDLYNNLITHLNQTWNGSAWITASGNNYMNTYSGSGKILVQVAQSWNGAAWDNVSQFTYTYNGNDQVTQAIRESWNSVTLAWGNTSKTDYVYDVSNVNIQTTNYLWNGSAWVNDTRIISLVWDTWTGDIPTSKPQSYTFQTWNGSTWVNSERLLMATYDGNGGSIELFQQYISGNWVNENRYSIFYDGQLSKTGERTETWNIPLAFWDTTYEYRYIFTYDGNNSITQSIYQEYDGLVHLYINHFRTDYSDFLLLGASEINFQEKFSVQLFPNPVTDFADVIILTQDFNPVLYQVYDAAGRRVISAAEKNKTFRIHKDSFSAGIYFLLVSDAKGKSAFVKFIVQ